MKKCPLCGKITEIDVLTCDICHTKMEEYSEEERNAVEKIKAENEQKIAAQDQSAFKTLDLAKIRSNGADIFKSSDVNIILGVIVVILFFPISLVVVLIDYFQRKQLKKEYSKFLQDNEKEIFFCYKSRKKTDEHVKFVKTDIIPLLPKNVHLIHLIRNKSQTKFKKEYIFYALQKIRKTAFPILMMINDGKMEYISLHDEIYNERGQYVDKQELVRIINDKFIPIKV